jgi:hypothetical protein
VPVTFTAQMQLLGARTINSWLPVLVWAVTD